MRSALGKHVLPQFKTYRLSSIKTQFLESWMLDLSDQGLSHKRINNIAGCLRVTLGEAKRQGVLAANPFDAVRPFANQSKDRGVFSIEEIRTTRLLDEPSRKYSKRQGSSWTLERTSWPQSPSIPI